MGKKSKPSAPPPPDYAAAATAQGQANIDAAQVGAELARMNQYTPYGSQEFTRNPDSNQWSSTTTLSPEQQRLYDLQTQGQTILGQTAVAGLGRVQDSMGSPFDISGVPGRVSSVGTPDYSLYDPSGIQKNLDFSSLGDVPTSGDYEGARTKVEDALYGRLTSRLDPFFKQREDQERTRLINSGVQEGTEAHTNAMNQLGRDRTDAYGSAGRDSILAGGAEQSRLTGDTLAGRAQMLNQILTGGQFNNAAQSQFMQAMGFNNQAEAQQFLDSIASGNFQNKQRGAAIDELSYLRSQPLNEYNALATGSQVTNPQFAATQGVQGPAAAPTFAATQAQDQRAIDLYNAQLEHSGSTMGGLYSMLGTLGGAAIKSSDRRLKSDIERIGHMSGTFLPVYRYTIDGQRQIGVMSDEVRTIRPDAVSQDANGYDLVDYGKISGVLVEAP